MNATKKALLKRVADILEKLGVASIAVALFQGNNFGAWLGLVFFTLSFVFTIWESKL